MAVDIANDLESFARALARLTDPFANRDACLATLHLNESQWRALEQTWFAQIEHALQAGDASLSDEFQAMYQAERRAITEQKRTTRDATTSTQRAPKHEVNSTGEAYPVFKPALPFRATEAKLPEREAKTDEASEQPTAEAAGETTEMARVDGTLPSEPPIDLDALPFRELKE